MFIKHRNFLIKFYFIINLILVNLFILQGAFAKDIAKPQNFNQAKAIIKKFLLADLETIYSGCKIKNNKIDFDSCGFKPNPNIKDIKLEFEHMLPMSHAKHHFQCWREPMCTAKNGKKFKGRRCCQQIDAKFRELEGELYNLMPEIGSINQARADCRFTQFASNARQELRPYRSLPLYIDSKLRKIEPRDLAKGIVARANLFVAQRYNIRLSTAQLKLFQAWNKQFPPTAIELNWAKKIALITGVENKYISNWQQNTSF